MFVLRRYLIGVILIYNYCLANYELPEDFYSFTEGYENVMFSIRSEDLNSQVKQKLHLEKSPDIHANIWWSIKKLVVSVENIK